ncbi:TfoX/Sxy family protein [Microvirga antarctica]|uniref:TfoX/Sxy family protein n=1 Tax=Microvirga antarctica TaxID=2819233 RepID=UPI001B3168D7|nr:TfoX/Sxy family protein [Microvirga antarctica]
MDADAIREIFRDLGQVAIRRMFGGQGIYRDGVMFALEARGSLFLKTDQETIEGFRTSGSRPFMVTGRSGDPMPTSYWLMPDSALDDPEEAAILAALALGAARRSRAKAAPKAKPPSRTRTAKTKSLSEKDP